MDSKALKAQFSYLRKIRKLGYNELRDHHDEVFQETKWWMKLPGRIQRAVIERRLYFWFAMNHYHYPLDTKPYNTFVHQAKRVLRTVHATGRYSKEEAVLDQLNRKNYFSKESILAMPIHEVDRYLTVVGIWADVDSKTRRKLLWSWFKQYDTAPDPNTIRRNQQSRITGVYCLRDIIVEHPDMNWDQFRDSVYGKRMPTVTRASFHSARYWARQHHRIPRHKRGPKPKVR